MLNVCNESFLDVKFLIWLNLMVLSFMQKKKLRTSQAKLKITKNIADFRIRIGILRFNDVSRTNENALAFTNGFFGIKCSLCFYLDLFNSIGITPTYKTLSFIMLV